MTRQLRRVAQLTRRERLLLLHVLVVIAIVRLSLRVGPLCTARRAAALAAHGRHVYSMPELAWAVATVARYLDATCLTQALAAHALLVRSGHDSRVEVGVSLDVCFRAHAWVVCGGAVVLGASEDQRYQRILVFD